MLTRKVRCLILRLDGSKCQVRLACRSRWRSLQRPRWVLLKRLVIMVTKVRNRGLMLISKVVINRRIAHRTRAFGGSPRKAIRSHVPRFITILFDLRFTTPHSDITTDTYTTALFCDNSTQRGPIRE